MTTHMNTRINTRIGAMETPFGLSDIFSCIYDNGSPAVTIVNQEGELVTYLSFNIPYKSHLLGPGEFFVRDWEENRELAKDALATGLFVDTGREVEWRNFHTAKVWKIASKESPMEA